jgi:hypothetical protein
MTCAPHSAAVARGEEARKLINNQRSKNRKEDKLAKFRTGGPNTPWTLVGAVLLAIACEFRGKNGAVPHPADSTEQIEHWEDQKQRKISPSQRTLLMKTTTTTTGFPAGTRTHSPRINIMQTYGKTEAVSKERKMKGLKKLNEKFTGQNLSNPVEGCAIYLLICFFRLMIDTYDRNWEVAPVFDGQLADFMIRRREWPPGQWVPIQMKSASECVIGKTTNYGCIRGRYIGVFVVCVGMIGYVHRTTDVVDPNDSANAPECSLGELWNLGSCNNTPGENFTPTFGVPYSKMISTDRRLDFYSATIEVQRIFAEKLLGDIEKWPQQTLNQILFDVNNPKLKTKVEKDGFKVVDEALLLAKLSLKPVWRQNECVDYSIEKIETPGQPLVFVSGKTGSLTKNKNDPKQRRFPLRKAVNKHFCDVVIASYAGAHHKVAVMSHETVYVKGAAENGGAAERGPKTFYWNEDHLKAGVRIFDDIRIPETARAFADHVLTFARKQNRALE